MFTSREHLQTSVFNGFVLTSHLDQIIVVDDLTTDQNRHAQRLQVRSDCDAIIRDLDLVAINEHDVIEIVASNSSGFRYVAVPFPP